jgi:hypothetical protein
VNPLFILLSNSLVDTILTYSGIVGVIFIFIYLPFNETISKQFFSSFTQRRKLLVLLLTPLLIWSLGILVIVLNFYKTIHKIENHKFYYQGQIVNEKGVPIKNAGAYIVLGTDTIKSIAVTGSDGNFTIVLDTLEGIKGLLYYFHPDYLPNSAFRTMSPSTNEQFVLKNEKNTNKEAKAEKSRKFRINLYNKYLISGIEKKTGYKFSGINPDIDIILALDTQRIEKIDNRFRFLGGKVQVEISGSPCCNSVSEIPPTHMVGFSKEMLTKQLANQLSYIVELEKDYFVEKISGCLKK